MDIWNIGGSIKDSSFILDMKKIIDFYDVSVQINAFDSPSGCVWDGGRLCNVTSAGLSDEEFIRKVKFLNSKGIGCYFVFSSNYISSSDLDDVQCNTILKECEDEMNGINLQSDILFNYISKTYPKYKLSLSLTHNRKNLEFYKDKDKYDTIILPPDLNKDFDFIKTIGADRVEVLANEICYDECPNRSFHYDSTGMLNKACRNNISLPSSKATDVCSFNNIELMRMPKEKLRQLTSVQLTVDKILKLKEIGVRQFKVSGRTMISGNYAIYMHTLFNFLFYPVYGIDPIAQSLLVNGIIDRDMTRYVENKEGRDEMHEWYKSHIDLKKTE